MSEREAIPTLMPLHIPRTDSTKKQEQLSQRKQELEHAIGSKFPHEKLVRAAEKLRAAHLSLLKAEFHWMEDARVQGRDVDARLANIQDETRKWVEMSVEEIMRDCAN